MSIGYYLQHLGLSDEPNDAEPMAEEQEVQEDVEELDEHSTIYGSTITFLCNVVFPSFPL